MRKFECTYNCQEDSYHPHFHFIINGKEASGALLNEWLNSVPTANRAAQDIRPAKLNSEKELFKYFSKVVSKTGKGENIVVVRAMDAIFQSMRGKRVFQPIGLKKVPDGLEDLEKIRSEFYEDLQFKKEITHWNWDGEIWRNTEGERLCEYFPSNAQKRFVQNNYIL
jgi:hypothetical protein